MPQTFVESLAKLPLASEMRLWDKTAIEFGIPDNMLMENAASALANFIKKRWPNLTDMPICLFMGSGNNGGDAAALARHLQDYGAKPAVFHLKQLSDLKGACAWHTRLALADNVPFIAVPEDCDLNFFLENFAGIWQRTPQILVDGLLGTGFSGPLNAKMAGIITLVNEIKKYCRACTIAIDIPSGLDCKSGLPMPIAIEANATLTLAAGKPGLCLSLAKQYSGSVFLGDIGMPQKAGITWPASARLLDGRVLLQEVSMPQQSHKNDYGHLLVIGGHYGLTGAAHLASAAALRSGAGLVTACAPKAGLSEIKANWPEIMTRALTTDNPVEWPEQTDFEKLFAGITALTIGPGMGRGPEAKKFLEAVLSCRQRPAAVIDADALILLAQDRNLLALLGENDILTPHPGEAAALLGTGNAVVQQDRFKAHSSLCELTSAVIVLKGADTLVGRKGEPVLICPYDIPQMAIGGSGDVLAGCMGALLARRSGFSSSLEVASRAVVMHVMAGLYCMDKYPDRGLIASQLADALAHVHKYIREQAKNSSQDKLPWP